MVKALPLLFSTPLVSVITSVMILIINNLIVAYYDALYGILSFNNLEFCLCRWSDLIEDVQEPLQYPHFRIKK